MPKFKLDWYAGASAQIEVLSPGAGEITYKLKYTPPFHSTIRPPVEDTQLCPEVLNPFNQKMDKLITTLDTRAADRPALPPGPADAGFNDIEMLGQKLLTYVIPQSVQSDLIKGDLFLEFGMDEELLKYPWELMHDGQNFLCLKNSIGRFVNAVPVIPNRQAPVSRLGSQLDKLSILLISVPNPQPRDNTVFESLPGAEAETQAICDVLAGLGDDIKLDILPGKKATENNVFNALKENTYDIVHYNGHAYFNEKKPYMSGLVLYDENLTTKQINSTITKSPPIFCFINACETTKALTWKERYNIFDLARAFLDTGTYLLGSRWKINDKAAAGFAKAFYTSLLVEGKPLGSSVMDARKRCKETESADDFAWASYILYGDPRICFRRVD
jgi:CHAT domain-containing protein